MTDTNDRVTRHYADGGLRARIEAALMQQGLDCNALTPRDLAPVDEFHSRGRRATRELAELAEPQACDRVLDVGAGVGGPARYLAHSFGCDVTGIDLTPEFCDVGNWLCECTGLAEQVRLVNGSGTVVDKQRLYAEIHRVLKPGGRLVLQELCAGAIEPCHYPSPWASEGEMSVLVTPDRLRADVESAGFSTRSWRDTSDEAIEWYAGQNAKASSTPSALGIHLVMGEMHKEKRANVERNYREGRLLQVMGAFDKAST